MVVVGQGEGKGGWDAHLWAPQVPPLQRVFHPRTAQSASSGLLRAAGVSGCGTNYEIGYAHSRGLPVIVFVSNERDEDLKMQKGGGSRVVNDFATALYLTVWAATCA